MSDERTFGATLAAYREQAGLSQSRLAGLAGYDHSYASRLESNSRMPTREAVLNLASALGLDDTDRDVLLVSAGFMPLDPSNFVAAVLEQEPVVASLFRTLSDPRLDPEHGRVMRKMIEAVVNGSEYAVLGDGNGRKEPHGRQEPAAGANGRRGA